MSSYRMIQRPGLDLPGVPDADCSAPVDCSARVARQQYLIGNHILCSWFSRAVIVLTLSSAMAGCTDGSSGGFVEYSKTAPVQPTESEPQASDVVMPTAVPVVKPSSAEQSAIVSVEAVPAAGEPATGVPQSTSGSSAGSPLTATSQSVAAGKSDSSVAEVSGIGSVSEAGNAAPATVSSEDLKEVPSTTSVSNQGPSSDAVATENAVATETTSNESSENSATVSSAGPTNPGVTPELSPSVTGVVANRELSVTEVSSALPGEPRSIELLIAEKTFRREKNSSAIRVTYDDIDLLKVLNMEPVPIDAVQHFPSWLKSLDGTTIRIRGFMYPTFEATGLTGFTLARDNGICCFVRQPKIYDIIAVELAAGVTSDYIEGKPFDVEGVFRIQPEADETELYRLYRIENARVLR